MILIVVERKKNVYVQDDADQRAGATGRGQRVRLPDKQPPHAVYARAAGGRAAQGARSVFDFVHHPHAIERHRNIYPRQTVSDADAL